MGNKRAKRALLKSQLRLMTMGELQAVIDRGEIVGQPLPVFNGQVERHYIGVDWARPEPADETVVQPLDLAGATPELRARIEAQVQEQFTQRVLQSLRDPMVVTAILDLVDAPDGHS